MTPEPSCNFVVWILGGLGNQMFQYAFAETLKFRRPGTRVYLDCSRFRGYALHNGFELERLFGPLEICRAPWKVRFRMTHIFGRCAYRRRIKVWEPEFFSYWPGAYEFNRDTHFTGYWQSVGYYLKYADRLQSIFTFRGMSPRNSQLAAAMERQDSVSIHVRRGDYLKEADFRDICDADYYRRGLSALPAPETGGGGMDARRFYIFSDDIA